LVRVGSDSLSFEVDTGWGQLPAGYQWGQISGVTVGTEDHVRLYTRTDHPVMVFDRHGAFVGSMGEGDMVDPHGVCIDVDGSLFFADRGADVVMKYSPDGKKLWEIGTRGGPSDTGWTPEDRVVIRAAGPFNWPTGVAMAADGGFYVSDGYRNARVHKFSNEGALEHSWGEPGTKPGQFNLVHAVHEHAGLVYVADRENGRIQVFSPDGAYVTEWPDLLQPTGIVFDGAGVAYVSELAGRVTLFSIDGEVQARIGSVDDRAPLPGKFLSPHAISADRHGDFYVTETLTGQRIQKFVRV
jgi:DNA-binding beta-propeller fold protein YncE